MKKKSCEICGKKFEPDTESQYACPECVKSFDIGFDRGVHQIDIQYTPPGPMPESKLDSDLSGDFRAD